MDNEMMSKLENILYHIDWKLYDYDKISEEELKENDKKFYVKYNNDDSIELLKTINGKYYNLNINDLLLDYDFLSKLYSFLETKVTINDLGWYLIFYENLLFQKTDKDRINYLYNKIDELSKQNYKIELGEKLL